jgi:hypothetical protein
MSSDFLFSIVRLSFLPQQLSELERRVSKNKLIAALHALSTIAILRETVSIFADLRKLQQGERPVTDHQITGVRVS